jgi:His-Xaa-Ser system radical SAM maturase HxsC
MKPLILSGRAAGLEIDGKDDGRSVFRIQDLQGDLSPRSERDVALVRGEADWARAAKAGFTLVVCRAPPSEGSPKINFVQLGREFAELGDGDVLRLRRERAGVRVLYRRASDHNAILVTERCNNYCLMCSQPPKAIDDGWILDEIGEAIPLIDPATKALTFTGGEPLTEWQRFLGVLEQTRDQLPDTAIHVLTNGRAFATPEIAKAWAAIGHPSLSAGIPIYSAVDQIHDYVVQARGAFDETVLGILRLKDQGQRVEVRVVLHAITAPRLRETCAWFARNLPFVDHVALMGLENTGFAIANDKELWIDPLDYQSELMAGVSILAAAGVRVSVYNLPLCVLAEEVRPHSVQSISDWKNAYVEECDRCSVREKCAGFFSTGRPKFSRGIRAISA